MNVSLKVGQAVDAARRTGARLAKSVRGKPRTSIYVNGASGRKYTLTQDRRLIIDDLGWPKASRYRYTYDRGGWSDKENQAVLAVLADFALDLKHSQSQPGLKVLFEAGIKSMASYRKTINEQAGRLASSFR